MVTYMNKFLILLGFLFVTTSVSAVTLKVENNPLLSFSGESDFEVKTYVFNKDDDGFDLEVSIIGGSVGVGEASESLSCQINGVEFSLSEGVSLSISDRLNSSAYAAFDWTNLKCLNAIKEDKATAIRGIVKVEPQYDLMDNSIVPLNLNEAAFYRPNRVRYLILGADTTVEYSDDLLRIAPGPSSWWGVRTPIYCYVGDLYVKVDSDIYGYMLVSEEYLKEHGVACGVDLFHLFFI